MHRPCQHVCGTSIVLHKGGTYYPSKGFCVAARGLPRPYRKDYLFAWMRQKGYPIHGHAIDALGPEPGYTRLCAGNPVYGNCRQP